jgi:DNA repair photolyase
LNLRICYQPKGRAREYAALAVNLYKGCPHKCVYCYVPCVQHIDRSTFHAAVGPVPAWKQDFTADCAILRQAGNKHLIHMSFTCDPYPAIIEQKSPVTREAIQIAHKHGQYVDILTKRTPMALMDLDILTPNDRIGVTLTCLDERLREVWEPEASSTYDRMLLLSAAKKRDIPTRVSFEPVLFPAQTLAMIERVRPYTDLIQVGKLNPRKGMDRAVWDRESSIDWLGFARDARDLLSSMPGEWTLKDDLINILQASGEQAPVPDGRLF